MAAPDVDGDADLVHRSSSAALHGGQGQRRLV